MPYNKVEQALIDAGWTEVEPGKFKSKTITHNQRTEVTVENIKYISFDYSVSSEKNYDIFDFYKNDTVVISQSGLVSGKYEYHNDDYNEFDIKFVYRKDNSSNTNEDCVYIYNIVISNKIILSDNTEINYYNRYNDDNYDYIIDINNNLWVKGNFLGNTYNDYTQIEAISDIKEIVSVTNDEIVYKNTSNYYTLYDGNNFITYIKRYNNDNSIFIIDINNNLWVKGDNEFGKLGCNSENNLIEDYIKIENEELINNVSEIDTYNENENAKSFFILKTKDKKIYFAGKFDNTEYRSWTLLQNIISSNFYYNKKKDKSKIYSKTFIINDYSNIPLFTFKKKNNFFAFKINLITDDEAIQFILSGNNDNIYIYTDYAVVPTIPFKFVLSNPDENENIVLYLSFDILNDREDYFNLIRKGVFVKIEDIHSNNFDINNIPEFDTENILYSKVFEKSDKGYFGSSDDINGVEIPYDFNDKFFTIDVNLDIGNTKSIINDINIRSDEYEDKEIIPYEDDNYKGPQFLYPIFYNLGIPFNKFIKFEGNITVNGIMYPVEYVKISTPIDENNKYGVIQFILSEDTKLLTDVSKSYLKEYEGIKINSDEIKENIFGITFYPIIINNDNEYEYRVLDDIPNTLISQNAAANWLIHDYKISDSIINKIVVKDDKCLFATDKDIYLFDLITLNPITTKHFTNNILSIGSQNNNEDSYDFVIKLSQNNYLLNKNTLDIISEIDINEIHLLDKVTDYFENINLAYALQNVRKTYINRYDIKGDNEQFIYEYKFENNENYFGFIKDNVSGKYRLSVYRDNMINNGIYAKTENVEIVPSIVESLDGILYCPENIVREGFPKSFDM